MAALHHYSTSGKAEKEIPTFQDRRIASAAAIICYTLRMPLDAQIQSVFQCSILHLLLSVLSQRNLRVPIRVMPQLVFKHPKRYYLLSTADLPTFRKTPWIAF